MAGTTTNPAVSVAGLSHRFGDLVAVDGLSLTVKRGEIFGLVGPDGAGKTTTMRMLCGVLLPSEGTAQVAGFDVVTEPAEVKRRTGYLSQQFSLYGDLTVWENLALCADLYETPRRAWPDRAEELLRASRMLEFKDRLADNLSGGMKQKLALSCALVHTPEVVFLDEPTTGVDPVSRREFWTILYRLPSDGVTVIVSTPYMDEAERCQRLGFMRTGRLLDCATPDQLKQRLSSVVLEVIARPARAARDFLRELPGVRRVTLFGDRLHAAVGDARADSARLQEALRRAGFEVERTRPVPAQLEDVFIDMSESEIESP